MKTTQVFHLVFISFCLIFFSCSSSNKSEKDKYYVELNELTTKLYMQGKMSVDSAVTVLTQISKMKTDAEKITFIEHFKTLAKTCSSKNVQ